MGVGRVPHGPPIGVFDSGLGGLTVLRALHEAAPNQPFLYLGDNANAPYGVQSADAVTALTEAGVRRLAAEGCRLIIIACNTASALALRTLQRRWTDADPEAPRVLGVFVPMIEALIDAPWRATPGPAVSVRPPRRRVLLFATPATVASGAFEREATARAPELSLISEACPGLVDALEAHDGAAAHALAQAATGRAMARAREAWGGPPEAAVLGCTHYPLARPAFRAALPADTAILSQPGVVAASLARYLTRRPEFESRAEGPILRVLTTGDAAALEPAVAAALGGPAPVAAV